MVGAQSAIFLRPSRASESCTALARCTFFPFSPAPSAPRFGGMPERRPWSARAIRTNVPGRKCGISLQLAAGANGLHTVWRKDALGGAFSWNLILLEHRSRSVYRPRTRSSPFSAQIPMSSSHTADINLVLLVVGVHCEGLGVEPRSVWQAEEVSNTGFDAKWAFF
jgi:hypothetical protein